MILLQSRGYRLTVAVAVGVWTAGFLIKEPLLAMLLATLATAAAWVVPVRPMTGGLIAVLASVVALLGDVPFGSVDLVALFAIVGVAAGRLMARPWSGASVVAGLAVTSAWRDGFTLEKAVVCLCVFGSFWLFGRVVRARAERAEKAIAAAVELARLDPADEAQRAVAAERERLAGEATVALRDAVLEMQASARIARERLEPGDLSRVRQRGAAAVDDLRELLIVLRSEAPASHAADRCRSAGRLRPLLMPVLTTAGVAAALAALAFAFSMWAPSERWQVTPAVWLLYGGVVLAVGLRARRPLPAALILAGVSAIALMDAPQEPYTLLPAAGAYLLVTWSAITAGTRSAWWGVSAMALAAVAVGLHYGEHGIGFISVLFTLVIFAAVAWGERDRMLRQAMERSDVLQEQLSRSVTDALRAERLRAARELHDTASHAVGVMMLHTGAAMALREKDPSAARRSLGTVEKQADAVLVRFDEGRRLFDEYSAGSTDADVGRLIERMRSAGMHIDARLAAMPASAGSSRTVFRLLQEGLANAGRHAPGSRVSVETELTCRGYRVTITDDGTGSDPLAPGTGFGLVGLRERVRALGGRFHAGPQNDGYRIEAMLPHVTIADESSLTSAGGRDEKSGG